MRTVTAVETRIRPGEAIGERSQRVQAELQSAVLTGAHDTVVLVEGLSDAFALEAAADRGDWDLRKVGVLPMGGATNVRQFVQHLRSALPSVRLAGLCDAAEQRLFARSVEHVFVCDRDLEDELIRAHGTAGVEALIDREGDLASLRRLQQMPAHRGRATTEHLHRFLGVRSGRKHRYAPLLTGALDPDALPRPLRDLLDHVGRP